MSRPIAALYVLLLIATGALPLSAQIGTMRETVPTPTAASLGTFGDVPVNLYTGIPNISIPLFTLKGRTLKLPITLQYHGGGIKVTQKGGWAGVGWALEAGGVITRTVHGLVDESGAGYYHTGARWYKPASWPTPQYSDVSDLDLRAVDGEPDQFFFNFAGHSGQFVMGPIDSLGDDAVRTIPYQKLRIVPTIVLDTITSFLIVTPDGTRYTFGAPERTINRTVAFANGAWSDAAGFGQAYNSSWYLTKIVAPGGDSITLEYAPYHVKYRTGISDEHFDDVDDPNPPPCVSTYTQYNGYEADAERLVQISSAAQTVTFEADSAGRLDALSPYPDSARQAPLLNSVSLRTHSGTLIRRFVLSHDYSIGGSGPGRLTLTKLSEVDASGDSLPPYTFTYVTSPKLPGDLSFSQDHWGYYNGASNTMLVPPGIGLYDDSLPGADRDPNASYMAAGTLTRITYPTGGSSVFTWEPNDYSRYGDGTWANDPKTMGGGLRIAQVRALDAMGDTSITQYKYTLSGDTLESSGVLGTKPAYGKAVTGGSACAYYSRTAMSRAPLGSGPVVAYREVTVWHGANHVGGSTLHTFRALTQWGPPVGDSAWPDFRHTRTTWKQGQPLIITEYNAAGQPQRRDSSGYTILDGMEGDGPWEPITGRVFHGISFHAYTGGDWATGPSVDYMAVDSFEVISAWMYRDAETATVYDTTGSSSFSTTKTWAYQNPYHAQVTKITETNSDGTERITRLKYPGDYNTNTPSSDPRVQALAAMQTDSVFMPGVVVEKWVSEKANGVEKVVQAVLTEFEDFAGRYLPWKRYILNKSN